VATGLAHRHPASLVGIHLNFPTGRFDPGATPTDEEAAFLAETARWSAEEGAYIAVQSTRPQTLAVALNDSPAGLLAWIVDKWRSWSDCDGDVVGYFGADRLLANATLYWATGTIRSSMHWYLEHRRRPPVAMRPDRIDVPTGVAAFPREIFRVPRSAVTRKYDLVRWTDMASGGHFPALERPEELAAEIRAFFRPLRAR
jgi:microsomal epoxide hydrolase